MADLLLIREDAADYTSGVIRLYDLRVIDHDHADKIIGEVEYAMRFRAAEITKVNLN